jgi:methyl-accepting chemotaxis protein
LYGNNRLETTANTAGGYGLAAQNQMGTDMLHDNLRGLVEQYMGAIKDGSATRTAESVKSLKENAIGIRAAFRQNESSDVLGTTSKAFIAKIKPLIDDYAKKAEEIAALTTSDAGELEKNRASFNDKFAVLETEMGLFNKHLQADISDTKIKAAEAVSSSLNSLVAVIVVGALLLVVSAVLIYRSIVGGLATLENTIEKVNQGDANARTQMTTQDELGHMGRSFDALLDDRIATLEGKTRENDAINNSAINLLQTVYALSEKDLTVRAVVSDDIVGTIASSVNQFAEETSETLAEVQQIADQVRVAAQSAQQQGVVVEGAASRERSMLDTMGITLGNASRQLTEVAALSSASAGAATRTSDATKAAQVAVEGSMRGMDSLREVISETEKRFKRLGERSQEISSAVALVNTISERTHVLSLNASMQAATAGEAGRGFAVVATEVQRLSDSSRQATGEIAKLVSNIQAETNETLITMNRLISDVVAQTELARRAGQEMNQTQTATSELVALVGKIASFSAEQQEMSQTLQKNVQGMNEGTAQTSSAITLQTTATDTLVKVAQRLNESVAQFKVGAAAA